MKKRAGAVSVVVILILLISLIPAGVCAEEDAAAASSFRLGITMEVDSLSPLISYTQAGYEFFGLIYDSLVDIDQDLKTVPGLAEEWSISSDNLTWTFKLRDNVKWHDGEPFTSADVKFTYDLLIKRQLGLYAGSLSGITSVECPDDNTVVIKTEKPKVNMLTNAAPILPKHIWEQVSEAEYETWANENPIGTGPFKFSEFKQGEYLKLVSNPDYFGGKPNIDALVFVLYANTDVMAQSLKLGEIDGAHDFSAAQFETLKTAEGISAISATMNGYTELSINCWTDPKSKGNPLLRDKKVRQAIELCIDKQKLLDMVYSGQGIPGTTLITPDGFYHYEPTEEELREYDVEKAKTLLESAGYTDKDGDGIREDSGNNMLSFRFMLRTENADEVKAGQMIASTVKDAGMELKVETVDDGVLQDRIYAGDFDMFIWGWMEELDPTVALKVLTTAEWGNLSDCWYSNKEYDDLFLSQQTKMDLEERQREVWRMQQIAYEDAPYIILYYDNILEAIKSDKWEGFIQIPNGGPYFFNLTNYNYMNMKPVGSGEGSSSNYTAIIVVLVLIAIGAVLFVRSKRRKLKPRS